MTNEIENAGLPSSIDLSSVAKIPVIDASLGETVCALANGQGGTIVAGISRSDDIIGVDAGIPLEEVIDSLTSGTEPAIHPRVSSHEVHTKRILIIEVPEAPVKPVAFQGRCFQRRGESNEVLAAHEIARLHLQSVGQSWDATRSDRATIDDLDSQKISHFLARRAENRNSAIGSVSEDSQALEQLGLVRDHEISQAAVLLFGRNPQASLSHARIKAGRFKSETVIIDEQDITGDLFTQIEQAYTFIRKHLTVRLVISGQMEREDVWDYPLEAIREGLINAVCHRDYTIPFETQIRIYDDQLLIWNPGGLQHNLSIEDLHGRHPSIPRNRLIASIFYEAGLIEKWGSGTNRIIAECRKLGLPEPEWREDKGIMLNLRKEPFTEDFLQTLELNDRQMAAVDYVKKRRRITNQEYQKLNEIKKRTATDDLSQLEEKGVFERIGSTGKGTYYKLATKGAKGA